MDEAIERARTEDRDVAAREIRRQVESEVEQKMRDELAAADTRMKAALADSEARAVRSRQDLGDRRPRARA